MKRYIGYSRFPHVVGNTITLRLEASYDQQDTRAKITQVFELFTLFNVCIEVPSRGRVSDDHDHRGNLLASLCIAHAAEVAESLNHYPISYSTYRI